MKLLLLICLWQFSIESSIAQAKSAPKKKSERKSNTYNTTINKAQKVEINGGDVNVKVADSIIYLSDKEYDLEDNFTLTQVASPVDDPSLLLYEIRPIHGIVYNAFVAYPSDEDSLVKGYVTYKYNNGNSMHADGFTKLHTKDGKEIGVKTHDLVLNIPATVDRGWNFYCRKLPSFLIVGKDIYSKLTHFSRKQNW